MQRFMGKTVVVTGSSSGIGRAAAERFSREGANVTLNGRSKEKLAEVAEGLAPSRTLTVRADISEYERAERLVAETVDRFGGIDVFVANAGIAVGGSIEDISPSDFARQIDVNVQGTFNCLKAAWPHLIERKGCVVVTSSVSGIGGDWGMVAYNASKGALTNMVRALALDYEKTGVRVNAVCPSFTKTDLTAEMQEDEELVGAFETRIPMGRAAEPEEVGDVIVFLASSDARFVNGVNLPVDGGIFASSGQPPLG